MLLFVAAVTVCRVAELMPPNRPGNHGQDDNPPPPPPLPSCPPPSGDMTGGGGHQKPPDPRQPVPPTSG